MDTLDLVKSSPPSRPHFRKSYQTYFTPQNSNNEQEQKICNQYFSTFLSITNNISKHKTNGAYLLYLIIIPP